MGEPLTRWEAGDGVLAESTSRLERALARLEDRLTRPQAVGAPDALGAMAQELDAAERRRRELEAGAAAASAALGRAMAEVDRVLQAEDEQPDLPLGLAPLDLEPGTVQETDMDEGGGPDSAGASPDEEAAE